MLKKFFKIKRQYRYIGAVVFFVIVGLLCALIFSKKAAPVTDTIVVPAGETAFSIDLNVDEAESYAGIEFALTLSDEDALAFATFTPSLSGAAASPFMEKDGQYYFGFFAGSNAFPADDKLVGALSFTGYTGDQTLAVTIVHMNVIRLDKDNRSVATEKRSPSYVFSIVRGT